MGLTTSTYEKKTYVSIVAGKFAVRTTADKEGAVMRFSEKAQKDIWEILYDELSGKIRNLHIESTPFGEQLMLMIDDIGEIFQVQIPVESKYFTSLCYRIKNVNLQNEVKLKPYSFESKDQKNQKGEPKKIIGINIFQNEQKVLPFFTKEDNKDKPTYGLAEFDADEYKIYQIRERKYFVNMIADLQNNLNAPTNTNSAPTETHDEIDTNDGLPF